MSVVRPFVAADIPHVADLHRRVFHTAEPTVPGWMESYQRYFLDVFLSNPLGDDTLTSLVCEDSSGTIVGFLGVAPRRMVFKGRPILAAVCSQFVVDPARRGQVGLRMVKHCLGGPQDLSLTDEAEDGTGKIWQWCGGATALLYSMHWIRPLRPARAALAVLRRRTPLAWAAGMSAPAARVIDALATRASWNPFRLSPTQGSTEDLDEAMLPAWLPELAAARTLRPAYDDQLVKWMLQRAGQRRGHGQFRKVLVRDDARGIAGWYLYYRNPGGFSEVLQVAAKPHTVRSVLDHLFDDAARQGAIALTGRLDPAFAAELSEKSCLLHRHGYSMLIHSSHPELLDAVLTGDAFLTRLEGEWCLRFQ